MDRNDPRIVGGEDYNELILTSNLDDIIWNVPLEQSMADNNFTIARNIPSREDFPGPYDFYFSLDHATSGQHWAFSETLKQLFIDMNKVLVMRFQVHPNLWTQGSTFFIRALPVYITDDCVNVPVSRCTFHSCEDDPQGRAHQQRGYCFCEEHNYVGHVVRAQCDDAEYLYDPTTERHSVRVLINTPQPGSECIPIPYSFACKTSCPKGMQRRPIHIIFTLENESSQVLGRQKLAVKICSCPKRDIKRHEKDFRQENAVGDKKKKKLITKEDLSNALFQAKKVKVENVEDPLLPENSLKKNQLKEKLNVVLQRFTELHSQIQEINELVNNMED